MLANEGTANCSFRTIILTRSSAGEPVFSLGTFTVARRKDISHIITHYSSSAKFPAVSNRANRNVRWSDCTPACYVENYRFVRPRDSCLSSRVPKYPLNCRNRERRGLYDLPSRHNMSSAADGCIDHKHLFRDSDSWIALLTDRSPDLFYAL